MRQHAPLISAAFGAHRASKRLPRQCWRGRASASESSELLRESWSPVDTCPYSCFRCTVGRIAARAPAVAARAPAAMRDAVSRFDPASSAPSESRGSSWWRCELRLPWALPPQPRPGGLGRPPVRRARAEGGVRASPSLPPLSSSSLACARRGDRPSSELTEPDRFRTPPMPRARGEVFSSSSPSSSSSLWLAPRVRVRHAPPTRGMRAGGPPCPPSSPARV
mmetsp:Transcript_8457/g.21839  ORF Transcript_8457/g.21839 Transcript_8457/m.21839 type:complete len:222 (+) Transcript_8457:67-732(+)